MLAIGALSLPAKNWVLWVHKNSIIFKEMQAGFSSLHHNFHSLVSIWIVSGHNEKLNKNCGLLSMNQLNLWIASLDPKTW